MLKDSKIVDFHRDNEKAELKDWEKALFFESREDPPLGTREVYKRNNSEYKKLKANLDKERAILDHPDLDGLNIVRVKVSL